MKIFVISLILVVFLSACFWGRSNVPDSSSWLELVESERFDIALPANWLTVRESELVTPSQWELVLAYRATESRWWYYNNIIIIENENKLRETDISLMNNNINTLRLSLQEFHLIAEDELMLHSWREGRVIVFSGKYGSQTPVANYIQTAISCGEASFFLTISVWSDLWDYTRYYPLLESFRCKW